MKVQWNASVRDSVSNIASIGGDIEIYDYTDDDWIVQTCVIRKMRANRRIAYDMLDPLLSRIFGFTGECWGYSFMSTEGDNELLTEIGSELAAYISQGLRPWHDLLLDDAPHLLPRLVSRAQSEGH